MELVEGDRVEIREATRFRVVLVVVLVSEACTAVFIFPRAFRQRIALVRGAGQAGSRRAALNQ